MVIDIVNKILMVAFFMCILNVIRHSFYLIRSISNKERFIIEKQPLLFLSVSIAYILMSLINGITI